jgi:hypothetical protein
MGEAANRIVHAAGEQQGVDAPGEARRLDHLTDVAAGPHDGARRLYHSTIGDGSRVTGRSEVLRSVIPGGIGAPGLLAC